MRIAVLHGCCKAPRTRSMVTGESLDAVVDGLQVAADLVVPLWYTCVLNSAVNAEFPGRLDLPKDCPPQPRSVGADSTRQGEWDAYVAEVEAELGGELPELDRSIPRWLQPVVWPLLRLRFPDLVGYLVSPSIRETVLSFLSEELAALGSEYVLVAHSLGSILGYELINRGSASPAGFMTAGSPMVYASIRKRLEPPRDQWVPWLNFSDPADRAVNGTTLESTEIGGRPIPARTTWVDNPPPDGNHDLYGYLTAPGGPDDPRSARERFTEFLATLGH